MTPPGKRHLTQKYSVCRFCFRLFQVSAGSAGRFCSHQCADQARAQDQR